MPGPGPGRSTRSWAATPAHDQYQQADAPGASVLGGLGCLSGRTARGCRLYQAGSESRRRLAARDTSMRFGNSSMAVNGSSSKHSLPSCASPAATWIPRRGWISAWELYGAVWPPEWPARGLLYIADVWDDQCGQGHRHGLAGVIWPVRAHKPGLRFWLRCIVGSSSDRDHLVCTEDF
jgi:hypothetical protein